MKAAVLHGALDLRVAEVELPRLEPHKVRVAVGYVGICGSDTHYWQHGKGTFSVVVEPLIMGHEVSGIVSEVGDAVNGKSSLVGKKVAVHPAGLCGVCEFCVAGQLELCTEVQYLGSAATVPHVQGGLCEYLDVNPEQIYPLPESVDLATGALTEPLSVALHAVLLAGNLLTKTVLVVGAGPIGLLSGVCAVQAGASAVYITDVRAGSLELAASIGLANGYNVSADDGILALSERAPFDVVIEASGSVAGANSALANVGAGGVVVQVGMLPAGASAIRTDELIRKQIDYRGSLRFGHEFGAAVDLLEKNDELGRILMDVFELADTEAAFQALLDPNQSGKILVKVSQE